jgi:cell division protein FtsB
LQTKIAEAGQKLYRSRRRMATAGVIVLAVMMGYHVIFGPNGWLIYQHKRAEYRQLQQKIDSLEQEKAQLQEKIHSLKTDPEAIEKEAREQLRYAKPGEVIYTVPAARRPAPATATAQKK